MDTAYTVCDEVFMDCQKKANPLKYLSPVNTKGTYQDFKDGKVTGFKYVDLHYKPEEVQAALEGLEIPAGPLHDLYEAKRKELLLTNELIMKRDSPVDVKRISKELYGSPDNELVEVAETILGEVVHEPEVGETPQEVFDTVKEELGNLKIKDWDVEWSKQFHTTFTTTDKRVTVCEDRKFHKGDKERTRVSLVDVHILRTVNGSEQDYGIFALGLPGYMATEEGLAAYSEELTENSQGYDLRKYAAVVMATKYMDEGAGIKECFDQLMEFKAFEGTDAGDLYALCTRVYRGGGYFKDHNYLKGYLDVKRFVEGGGNIALFWVGKVGLHDLALVNQLLTEGKLRMPERLPSFVK